MPLWEHYEVEVETKVVVIAKGRPISEFTVYGQAKGGSNESVDRVDLKDAVRVAINRASTNAVNLAAAVRDNRRREIGYTDGD